MVSGHQGFCDYFGGFVMQFSNKKRGTAQKITTETKLHYRIYKDGKKWVVAGIAAVALMIVPVFAGNSVNVAASDDTPTTQVVQPAAKVTLNGTVTSGAGHIPDPDVTIVHVVTKDASGAETEVATGSIDAAGKYHIEIDTSKAPSGSKVYVYTTYSDDDKGQSSETDETVPFYKPELANLDVATATDGYTVSGNADPGAQVVATDKNGKTYTGTSDNGGSFSIDLPQDVAGQTLNVVATNGAGTEGAESSEPETVTVPQVKPDAPTAKTEAPANGIVKVNGKATPGAGIVIRNKEGKAIATATADGNGDYHAMLTTDDAPEGTDLEVTQNVDGAESDPTPTSVPVHVPDAPTATAAAPADGKVHVTGTGEPGATVNITPENGADVHATVDNDGKFTADVPAEDAPSGSDLTVNQSKNGRTGGAVKATVPDAKPATPIVTAEPNPNGGTTISGTGDPDDTVTITPEGGKAQTVPISDDGTFSYTIPEDELPVGGKATVVEHGNGGDSDPAEVTAPAHAPEVTVGTPKDGQVPVTVKAEPGADVTITPEGSDPITGTADDNGDFTAQIPVDQAPEGTPIKVKQAVDGGEPSAETTENVPYHTPDKPGLAPTAPDEDGNVVVKGTGEKNADITLTTENGKQVQGTTDDNGDFSINIPETDAPSGSEVTAVQTVHGVDSPASTKEVPYAKPDQPGDVQLTPNDDGSTTISGTGDPDDTITVTPKDGDPITVPVKDDGTFTVKVPGDDLPDNTPVTLTQDGKGGSSDPLTTTTPVHKPEVTVGLPVDGKVPVTGTAVPGAEVTVTPKDGDPITTTADPEGKYSVDVPVSQAPEGTDVGVTQKVPGGDPSATTTATVPVHTPAKPTVEPAAPAADGTVVVTGKGEPGASVTVTPENGQATTVPVMDDGTYTASFTDTEAPEGSTITAVQTKNGKDSPEGQNDVPYAKPDKPVVTAEETPTGTKISGTGDPDDTITITPENGDPITVPIKDDGTFSVDVPEDALKPGTKATVTETGKGGTSDEVPVDAPFHTPDAPSAQAGEPVDGKVPVSGTAEPGATITITPEDGDPVTTTADDTGLYTTEVPTESAPEGSKLDVTQTNHGKTSESTPLDVPYARPVAQVPTVADPANGTVKITGTGTPGDTVTLTPANGGKLTVPVNDDGTYAAEIPLSWAPYGSDLTAVETGKGGDSEPVTATVPLQKLGVPTGQATVPVDGLVTVTGDVEPNADVTLTTQDGEVFNTTADGKGEFTIQIPSTSAKIGSDISVTQSLNGTTSLPGTIAVPHREALNAPTVEVSVDRPAFDFDSGVTKTDARLRMPADHLQGMSGSLNQQTSKYGEVYSNPRIRLFTDAEGKNMLTEVSVDPTTLKYHFELPLSELIQGSTIYVSAFWHVEMPEGINLSDTTLVDENGDIHSPFDHYTVPFAEPDAPQIAAAGITNDGTAVRIKGVGDMGTVIQSESAENGRNSVVPSEDDQSFQMLLPSEQFTPGMVLAISEVNGDKTSQPVYVIVPEVNGAAEEPSTTDPTATTDPATDETTEPTTDQTTDETTEPTTDPATDETTEPTTDPATDETTDPTDDDTAKLEDEIKTLTAQVEQLKTQLGEATSTTDDKDDEIAGLNDEIAKLKTQLGDATSANGDTEEEIAKLNDEIEQLKTQLGTATSTTGDKDDEIAKLNDEIDQLKTDLGTATSTTGNTDDEIAKLNDEIEQLKTELGNATSATGDKDDEIAKLNDEIEQLKTDLGTATSTTGNTDDEIAKLNDEIAQLRTELGNATSTTGDKDAEINQLNDEIEQLKTQLGNATSTTANTDAAIDQLNDEIDQLKTDLGTATATAGAKDDAIDQLNNQIDQLNGKITQLQQDLTDKETQQPATTDDVTLPSTDGDADTTDQPQVTLPSTGGDTDEADLPQVTLPSTGGDAETADEPHVTLPSTGGETATDAPAPTTVATTTAAKTSGNATVEAAATTKHTLPSTGGAMPQTGDEQNSGLTIAGILAAAMSMLGLSYFSRKREN
jgi:LPXTG-motif cell wall-anchored protein